MREYTRDTTQMWPAWRQYGDLGGFYDERLVGGCLCNVDDVCPTEEEGEGGGGTDFMCDN